MSRNSSFGTVLYSAESSWAEASGTPSIRLPVLEAVDLSGFKQSKIEPGRVVQRLNDGITNLWIRVKYAHSCIGERLRLINVCQLHDKS